LQPFSLERLPEKVLWLLEEGFFAYFGTADLKGSPHVTPVTFVFDGESIFTVTSKFSRKIRNLRENPKAAVLIDVRDPENLQNNWAVLLRGEAKIYGVKDFLAEFRRIVKVNRLIRGKYPKYFEYYMREWKRLPKAWKPCLFRSRLIVRFDPKEYVYMRETMPTRLDGGTLNFQGFLRESSFAYLCTVEKDGMPHVVPIFFHYDEGEGSLWTLSPARSRKIANLKVNRKACLTIDVRDPVNPANNRGVMVRGEAFLHEACSSLEKLKRFMGGQIYRSFQEKYPFFEEWLCRTLGFPLVPVEIAVEKAVCWRGTFFQAFKLPRKTLTMPPA